MVLDKREIQIITMKRLAYFLFACSILTSCFRSKAKIAAAELKKALAEQNLVGVRASVSKGCGILGKMAGEPELPDAFRRVPAESMLLSAGEAQTGFTPYFDTLEKMRWWIIGVDPTRLTSPLRGPASVILGNVAAVRAKLDGAERSLAIAKDAADFLIWAQEQAGSGVYPFPAARWTSNAKAMEVGTHFIIRAEKAGKIDAVVRNGWVFDDAGDGGLQFDNGECGLAMLNLYDVTKDNRHLESARKAADWAVSQPLCSNWNYNSFSVMLLAKIFDAIRDDKYLEAAILKARLGVIPGQLTEGPHAGRWGDRHNARPAYHYIMMRALAQLATVIPKGHVARPEIMSALSLGLKTRNTEMVERGVMNKDHALQSLLLVNQVFKKEPGFLSDTRTSEALDAISRLVSEDTRHGKQPLSPAALGLFLESIANHSVASP